MTHKNVSVLYDNRDARPGEKFADADLMGMPHRVVISDKTVAAGTYEYKQRSADAIEQLPRDALLKKLGA